MAHVQNIHDRTVEMSKMCLNQIFPSAIVFIAVNFFFSWRLLLFFKYICGLVVIVTMKV